MNGAPPPTSVILIGMSHPQAEEFLQSMLAIANSLPQLPDETIDSQLLIFDMFTGLIGPAYAERAAALLQQAAGQCQAPDRRHRLQQAATALLAGQSIARTPEGLTVQQAAAAQTISADQWQQLDSGNPHVHLPALSVRTFFPGLTLRVTQTFRDNDGYTVPEGAILHLLHTQQFRHDDSRTLKFRDRVVRLCATVEDQEAIINDKHNDWFEPVIDADSLRAILHRLREQLTAVPLDDGAAGAQILADLDACDHWLHTPLPRPKLPHLPSIGFRGRGPTKDLARRLNFLYAGLQQLARENR